MKQPSLQDLCVAPTDTVRVTAECIDRNTKGIALITDETGCLLGTITDGDIRRGILAGVGLDAPVSELQARKMLTPYAQPVSAPLHTETEALLALMQEHGIRQVPLLTPDGRVIGIATLDDLLPQRPLSLQAVIMAGGFGTRLRPYTDAMPKPMLTVGDRPLMQRIVEQLRDAGIRRVNVTTHFLPEKITAHFGDGHAFGVEMNYVTEDRPLGTAGALSLLQASDEPILVINGDILTRVDFRAMLDFHREQSSDLTIGVRQHLHQVPYGVVTCAGARVTKLQEKPRLAYLVNAGIYLLEPSVWRYLPNGERYDMTDLIQRLLTEGRVVASFPIMEYWRDIGQLADYEQAQQDYAA